VDQFFTPAEWEFKGSLTEHRGSLDDDALPDHCVIDHRTEQFNIYKNMLSGRQILVPRRLGSPRN